MISRPLKLAAHLRDRPGNFDILFIVNAGLLALFFTLFGSRFVLSPGLPVDFKVPAMAGVTMRSLPGSREVGITVDRAGLMYVNEGMLKNVDELRLWLRRQFERKPGEKLSPSLRVLATEGVPLADLIRVMSEGRAAGFEDVSIGVMEAKPTLAGDKP